MDRERWQRVEEIFNAALEQPDGERASFVEQACFGDTTLRDEVAALLRHDDLDASFMETPVLAAIDSDRAPPSANGAERDTAEATLLSDTPPDAPHVNGELPAGHRIENYRIVRKTGAGGMGDVYLAEDLQLGRRVALKLLPPPIQADGKSGRRFLREARAASALNHPHIVTIHSVKDADGQSFIEMEFIEGESLRDRLLRGPLDVSEVISLGLDAADAASAAHAINIVHRDLKPGNILFTTSGKVKIVDFGLAKAAGAASGGSVESVAEMPPGLSSFSISQVGSISGTVPYMSPEQTRGEHVDARSDIFSLGCVLYEAATGRRPFEGDSPAEIIQKIREQEPLRPSAVRAGLPRGLDAIILRSLAKDKTQRFSSAADQVTALRRLQTRETLRRYWKRIRIPAAVILIAAVAFFGWDYRRKLEQQRIDEARGQIPQIQALVDDGRFFEAHDLAHQIAPYLSGDPEVENLNLWVTDVLSVTTEPPGASVYLQRYQPDASGRHPERTFIGTTPIENLEIARGEYLLSIEKDGHVPFQRTMSNALNRLENGFWNEGALRKAELIGDGTVGYGIRIDSKAPIDIEITLLEQRSAPENMVFVPGGRYRLVGGGRPTEEAIELNDFFIDRFEVTNHEYREFVDAGGYANPRYWRHAFTRHDTETHTAEELSWEEGIGLLIDSTGEPGPRSWSHGQYPAGKDDHPVTDVTWYEAAAYAEFRGKQLPTIFQWEKAARDGQWTVLWPSLRPWGLDIDDSVLNRANVSSNGTTPVGSFPFGMSTWGCHDMLGNVWEWCANPRPHGFTRAGGSWLEGPHLFSSYGQFPGFYSADNFGFRCVLNTSDAGGDQGGMLLPDVDEFPQREPLSEESFRLIRAFYEYDRKELDAEIVEQVETTNWIRLKVRYIGAMGQRAETRDDVRAEQRALAYLWLPNSTRPPFQVVNYKPGGASYEGLTVPQETEMVCGPILHSGRAVFVAVTEGMTERPLPPEWEYPEEDTVAYRDMFVYDTLDQRIGLDYLATRDDIDMEKIVGMGLSLGGFDLVTMAVEDRFQGVLLLAAGIGNPGKRIIDAADAINFAPYIEGSKMMIHGRYDDAIPFETRAVPLYELLSGEDGVEKELIVLESGHFPPMDQWVPHALRFLDRTLGPVETTVDSSEIVRRGE